VRRSPSAQGSGPSAFAALPASPGSYVLVFRRRLPARRRIGALGVRTLPAGRLCYAGSAHGPGGLRARVLAHAGAGARRRWHADYLHDGATLAAVLTFGPEPRLECRLAAALSSLPGARRIRGFGASDCRCPGHLVALPADGAAAALAERLGGIAWLPAG
jgi:Uri superfamily endonuclease